MRRSLSAALLTVLLVAAGLAAATHEQDYAFGWQETPQAAGSQGYLYEGESTVANATLPANLTRLDARLRWQDDRGLPDHFRLLVEGPAGFQEVNGTAGEIVANFTLATMPVGNVTLRAANETDARARLAAQHPADLAYAGEWRFTVVLSDAGDDGGGGLFPFPDRGNSWTLEISWAAYAAVLVAATPVADAPAPDPDQPPAAQPGAYAPDPVLGDPSRPLVTQDPAIGGTTLALLGFGVAGIGAWIGAVKWRKRQERDPLLPRPPT